MKRIVFNGISRLLSVARADGDTGTGGTGSTGSKIDWAGSLGGWLSGLGDLLGGVLGGTAALQNGGTGTGTGVVTSGIQTVPPANTKSNTVAWVIGGVVMVAAIVGLIFFARKKK
jgi:hypothetical protein